MDQYGNLNSTQLGGTYERPGRRFPGSGGGNEAASFVWKTIVVLKHEARRFVEKVDFLTSPGYLDGPGARERAGLPRGTGPWRVVTSKALFDFHEDTKRLRLIGVLKGLDPAEVISGMGFSPISPPNSRSSSPPRGVSCTSSGNTSTPRASSSGAKRCGWNARPITVVGADLSVRPD